MPPLAIVSTLELSLKDIFLSSDLVTGGGEDCDNTSSGSVQSESRGSNGAEQ
ncbi:hypothetical protein MMC29_004659, partial [Sticta canariensis]|nr:hypothetical protein [Sticta canariensis]